LSQQIERLSLYSITLQDELKALANILQCPRQIRLALRQAKTTVINQKYLVAVFRQPGDVVNMCADVLGVTVQKIDCALDGCPRIQPPAMNGEIICRGEEDVFVFKAQLLRGLQMFFLREKEDARATVIAVSARMKTGRRYFFMAGRIVRRRNYNSGLPR
jgi:hypothetical protein